MQPNLTRRRLLQSGAATLLGGLSVMPLVGHAKSSGPDRTLSFHSLHTEEKLTATFWSKGQYLRDGLSEIQHILRDWRANEIHQIDPALLDLLYDLRDSMNTGAPFEIISGYRSPGVNKNLRRNSNGVAKRSLHMRGMAVDIRLPGRRIGSLRDAALKLKRGGVGYYPKSNFIHVDTGRVRRWG